MAGLIFKANKRDNNFDFLRIMAALAVMVSHNFAIFGFKEPTLFGYNTLGGIGVSIFFIMSGFLIAKSWNEKPFITTFLKKRVLRIFPALFIVTLFCSFVIGPLVTILNFQDYLRNIQTWYYLRNIFLFRLQFNLPGVFLNNPIQNIVNGPLWTLPIEVLMYVFIGVMGFCRFTNKKSTIPILLLLLIILNGVIMFKPFFYNFIVFYQPLIVEIKLPIFFFMGSFFYIYSERIFLDGKIAICALFLFIASISTQFVNFIGYFTLSYLIIYFAFKGPYIFRNFGKYGDFSYGIYIYAWPIQQTLVFLWSNNCNFIIYSIAVFIITLFLAIVSWHFIEKPALNLKNKKLRISSDILPKM